MSQGFIETSGLYLTLSSSIVHAASTKCIWPNMQYVIYITFQKLPSIMTEAYRAIWQYRNKAIDIIKTP